MFLVRAKLDTGDQQLVNGGQKTRIDGSWISNLLDRAQHTKPPAHGGLSCLGSTVGRADYEKDRRHFRQFNGR